MDEQMKISKLKILQSFLQTKHWTDIEKLRQFQQKKLRHLLSTHKDKFYPNSLNLEDYPIIDKAIFMANFNQINTVGITNEGIDGIIKNEENGFLIRPTQNDIKKVLNKISDLNEQQIENILRNCYNTVICYNSAHCAEKYLENILKII